MKNITVKELIAELQKHPADMPVICSFETEVDYGTGIAKTHHTGRIQKLRLSGPVNGPPHGLVIQVGDMLSVGPIP